VLNAQEHSLDQHVHGEVVVVDGGRFEWAERTAESGVVEHDVEGAPSSDSLVDCGCDLFLLRHVDFEEVSAVGTQLIDDGLTLLLVHVGDKHVGTLIDEQASCLGTDAARRSRDDGRASFKSHVFPPGVKVRVVSASEQLGKRAERAT